MRVKGASTGIPSILMREGIELKDLVARNTRIRHRAMMELVESALQHTCDPLLGLRAGRLAAPSDFVMLGDLCPPAADLRQAIGCVGRYMHLLHGAQEARLVERDHLAIWQLHITDSVPQLSAVNDFALSSACWLLRSYADDHNILREVHFMHSRATDLSEYKRVFGDATIEFDRPNNALAFERSFLDTPMAFANPGLMSAFEKLADEMLETLLCSESIEARVRRLIIKHIATRGMSMAAIAQSLSISESTLRRRLAEEGTSYNELLVAVRTELAHHYLADRRFAASDVAMLLGFAHVSGLYRAFKRWTGGSTPAKARTEVRAAERFDDQVTPLPQVGCEG